MLALARRLVNTGAQSSNSSYRRVNERDDRRGSDRLHCRNQRCMSSSCRGTVTVIIESIGFVTTLGKKKTERKNVSTFLEMAQEGNMVYYFIKVLFNEIREANCG